MTTTISGPVALQPVGGTTFAAWCGELYLGRFEAGSIDGSGQWVEPGDEDLEDVARRELGLSIETEIDE